MSKKRYNQGFTLIETFVAVLILVFAVLGPLGLLSQAIANGNYAKNQITAYYLAQESIEEIINQRDRNWRDDSNDWLDNINNKRCLSDNKGCPLYVKNGGDIESYTYNNDSNNELSIFSRKVAIEESLEGDSAEIVVTIFWSNKGRKVNFELDTVIYNLGYDE